MENYLGITNITKSEGVYFTEKRVFEVSFPDDGHKLLAEIEETSFWFKYRNKIIKYICKKYKVRGLFYDIGGGNGFVSMNIKSKDLTPVLIEPMIDGALIAKKRKIPNIICSDLKSLNFQSKMEYAGVFDVVEHIKDDLTFLKAINESLTSNGLLFITVPAFNFLWSEIDQESGHFRRYNKSNLKSVLKKANYDVLETRYFFSYLVPAMLLFGRKNKDETGNEHKTSRFKGLIIKILNNVDYFLFIFFKGIVPGASILVVAQKNTSKD